MTFLYLVPTGMNDPERPTWGSWAGRHGLREDEAGRNYYFANQQDTWHGATHRDNTLARWAADLQRDFQARLDWCVTPVRGANHPPRVAVSGPRVRRLTPGTVLTLSAANTTDPDGDGLTFAWEIYPEPGRGNVPLTLEGADRPEVTVTAPAGAQGEAHVLLTVRDDGEPPLARYARVVLVVGE
jgi:hypothetical protein